MPRAFLWLSTFLIALGNGPSAAPARPTALHGDLSALRSRFNADAGKVRAIFLISPT
jgi:hypothetical protein